MERSAGTGKALVACDWNGTLLDDVRPLYRVARVLCERYGRIAPPLADYRRRVTASSLPQFFENLGLPVRDKQQELAGLWIKAVREMWHEPSLRKGTWRFIELCRRSGVFLAIVSAEYEELLLSRLRQFRLSGSFDAVAARAGDKSAALRNVLDRFGVEPADAYYVDDTTEGLRTAKSLGITTIGITTGHYAEERIRAANPHHLATDFNDVAVIVETRGKGL